MRMVLVLLSIGILAQGASWREEIQEAQKLHEAGKDGEAERIYRSVVAQAQQMDLAASSAGFELNSMGHQFYFLARYQESELLYRLALKAFDHPGWETSLNRALTVGNLGVLLRAEGKFGEAQSRIEEALRQVESITGPDSLDTARVVSNLSSLLWSRGHLEEAESLALRADGIFERSLEKRDPERVSARQILASIYLGRHRYADAEALLQDLLEGAGERAAATIYSNLSVASLGRGDFPKAEEFARHAVEFSRKALPPGHPALAVALNNLAQACRFQEEYLEAEKNYREAINVWESSLGPRHPDVGKGLMNLAGFYHDRGREAGAEELYRRAAQIFEQALGAYDPQTLIARNELAEVLRAERRYTEAEKLARTTLGGLEKAFQPEDPRLVRAQSNYSRLLGETKRTDKTAKALLN